MALRFYWIRWKLRRLHRSLERQYDDFDCGRDMAQYIRPSLALGERKLKVYAGKLKELET